MREDSRMAAGYQQLATSCWMLAAGYRWLATSS
jgi:hypothetical protein